MRIVETGAKQCWCGSTRVRIGRSRSRTGLDYVDCDGCGVHLSGGRPEDIAVRFAATSIEPPRVPLHDERGAVVGSVDPSAVVPVAGTTRVVDMPSLDCPSCKRPRRERGEVRVHFWACGCSVAVPEPVRILGTRGERLWYVDGGFPPAVADHPTREGAIAAWRTALADEQRREDERAARPVMVATHDDQVDAMSRTMSRTMSRSLVSKPDGTVMIDVYPGGFVTQQDVGRGITEALERAADRRRNKTTATMPAAQSAELVRATVPAIDIDALSLEGLCELATELANRHPERMQVWERGRGMSPNWLGIAWTIRPSTCSDGATWSDRAIIERRVKWNSGMYCAAVGGAAELRDLVRQLSGESVSDSAFARSLAEVK